MITVANSGMITVTVLFSSDVKKGSQHEKSGSAARSTASTVSTDARKKTQI